MKPSTFPQEANSKPQSRRSFLRNTGVSILLPAFASLRTSFASAKKPQEISRLLVISNNLGFLPKRFFPSESGANYQLSPTLEPLAPVRKEFSVFSGMSHPDVAGGHSAENCFLTGARGPTKSGFRNQISLDQFAVEKLGQTTRFATLNLGVNIDKANRSLSWTRDGVLLPAEDSAASLFRRMFTQGDPETVQRQIQRLKDKASILDTLTRDARQITRQMDAEDRSKMDQYLTSIREVENRLQTAQEWELRPKPVTHHKEPAEITEKKRFLEKVELMLTMARIAFESDSTRIITLMLDAFATPAFQLGDERVTTEGYHGLSHHGQSPEKVSQLEQADLAQMRMFRNTIESFGKIHDGDARLLDRTCILFGSNMSDANTHDNTNLPILLAGGGFKHGSHHAFKRDSNLPLCNLYVSLLQRLGVETTSFGTSTGSLSQLV
jgi:hypothetical protein